MTRVTHLVPGTVRNSLGEIVQFLYGEDGLDATSVETQKLDSMHLSTQGLEKSYRFFPDDVDFGDGILQPEIVADIKNETHVRSALDKEFEKIKEDRTLLREDIKSAEDKWPLPVNLKRLVWTAQKIFAKSVFPSDLHPLKVVESINALSQRLVVVRNSNYHPNFYHRIRSSLQKQYCHSSRDHFQQTSDKISQFR